MLLKIGQARLINFIGIPYKCKPLRRCFFLGIWKHLPKWKILSSNEGTFDIQKAFPKYQGKKPLEDASLQKTLACYKLGCPTGLLELSGLLLRAISNFLAYSLLRQPPWTTSLKFLKALGSMTSPLLFSLKTLYWSKGDFRQGSKVQGPMIQAILLVESFKSVPRSLDEGPRPKGGKLRLTLHGTCFGGKINWFGPKKQC
jgi:hypothetical protein